ncbi:hypothetical protein GT695_18820 [Citrobacter amalonaticus]|nr:hypothetical protein [Citrobacter amalonaticus]
MTRFARPAGVMACGHSVQRASLVDGGQVTVALDKEKNELTYGFQSAQKHKPEAAH